MVEQAHEESEGPSIEDADVIVAGGRGLGGPENFALVEELAKALGGAVAATRAVVDAGWYPYAAQVGQTGKTVSPKLYVAVRHLRRDPAQGRDAELERDRRDQQGPERADLRVRRPRRRRRPARDRPEADRARPRAQGAHEARPTTRRRSTPSEFVAADRPGEERIEVGVLIVGAGPAGLACAIRLGQLLEEAPELAERLGDVPVAVLEKGKQPGSHLLSGAVVNPRSLRRLFQGRVRTRRHAVLRARRARGRLLPDRRGGALRIPTPPTMRNHGNYVASLSQLGRWLAEQAEEGGATILPETTGHELLVDDGRVAACAPATRAAAADGEELAELRARAPTCSRRVTVLAEGTQGHLTGVAIDRFGLQGENPQVWALGVKEVWKVAKPLDRVIHTMGWPLRGGRSTASSAARSSTRWARTWSRSGWSSGSTTATPSSPSTTCSRS